MTDFPQNVSSSKSSISAAQVCGRQSAHFQRWVSSRLTTAGGAYVTDLKARTLLAPLDFFISLSPSNLADVFESRSIIEIEIVRKAAVNATPDDVEALNGMLAAHEKVLTDPVGFRILDARFHSQLSEIAGNSVLERIAYGLYNMGLDIRRRATENVALIRRSLGEHTTIVRAIEAGDSTAAATAMAVHLAHIEASTRAVIEEDVAAFSRRGRTSD
nr:FCD domain-containing protein [Nordella sp. HKS 07]